MCHNSPDLRALRRFCAPPCVKSLREQKKKEEGLGRGDVCLIERLVKAGLSPDAATADDGRTALHLAAGEGKLRVASKLVELGADVHFTDRQGRNALDIARAAGYYDLEARLRLLAET